MIVDGFAGPGGWSEGLRMLGLADIGLEWDEAACKTRKNAGHMTVRIDIATFVVARIIGKTWGLIMSPPCTKFSTAGNGVGRKFISVLADGIRRMMRGEDCRQELRDQIYPEALAIREAANQARKPDKQWPHAKVEAAAMEDTIATVLVVEPARFLYALICQRPHDLGEPLEWVAFEQVPSVLPLWEVYAGELERLGWSVWTGKVNAANHGVPQTRTRAVLIASSLRKITGPTVTHSQTRQEVDLFGDSLPVWVTMADALGWGATDRDQRPDGSRQTADPAAVPAPSLTAKSGGQWVLKRPATTVCATNRLSPPGHRDRSSGGESQFAGPDTVRITVQEASILQSFPADYPWQGTKTKQFEQVGNAVPPLLAAHLVSAATGIPMPAADLGGLDVAA
ncbi:hypothetical protein SNA_18065 [Streptomyces natalensis ATCC 27448]|uniref:DNA (cytosine-5-)-methyltransferase n=1 Tax=Streptomyces natalensis ATCC 27448 TaxID=1240678 RepID=A0A0D7CLD0_9ACTN|nr:hypothetical protein SNA_18065 [Streptomyces natalensis ATCC 27448]